jgi:hypothetical protein
MTATMSIWTRTTRMSGALLIGVLWAAPTSVLGQGTLSGNVSGSASGFTGVLDGEVSGPQGATVVDSSIARDTEIVPTLLAADGAGSGVDADLLDGLDSSAFVQTGANTFSATQAIASGNLDLQFSDSADNGNIFKEGTRFLHDYGGGNTFLGEWAGNFTLTGTANTAIGSDTLTDNTLGQENTASGYAALNANTTGSNNTASGYAALNANTTGSNNTAIGHDAGLNATTGDYNIYLGANVLGVADESNTMYLGLQGTQTKTVIAGIRGTTTGMADAIPVLIDSDGQVGTVSSSRRYKEDIAEMAGASNSVLRLRPVTFRYKKAFTDGSKPIQYGLIAEEVAEVFPDLVVYNGDGEPETVKYHLLATMLVNELQKQRHEFQALQQLTADQAAQLVSLERQARSHQRERDRLAAVEATLAELTALTARLAQSAPQARSVEVASR